MFCCPVNEISSQIFKFGPALSETTNTVFLNNFSSFLEFEFDSLGKRSKGFLSPLLQVHLISGIVLHRLIFCPTAN